MLNDAVGVLMCHFKQPAIARLPLPLKGGGGGCHNFQYFDHKSSWHWDWWENFKK